MKRKIEISLMMALLMVVSTFAVGAGNVNNVEALELCDSIILEKEVWDDSLEEWVEEIDAKPGETVSFKITLTYYNVTDPDDEHYAHNIIINDTLPECFTYVTGSSSPFEPDIDGNILTWDLGDTKLYDEESYEITFDAIIDEEGCIGEHINTAETLVDEHCTGAEDIYDSDTAIVNVVEDCIPGIEVNKTVWNGEAWVDEYVDDYFKIGDIIKFKIHIVYTACEPYTLLNMVIKDILPDCLEYHETLSITSTGSEPEAPYITTNGKIIYWNWTGDSEIGLDDGDSLTLEFDTVFTEYCCGECCEDNYVHVLACGCPIPEPKCYEGEDWTKINCKEPPTTFDKYVKDDGEWVKEIETYYGNTLEFKLELIYNLETTLTWIQFIDVLPCILTYVDDSAYIDFDNITFEISEDGKTLWFNSSAGFELKQGETITITFQAKVTGCTQYGCDCYCEAKNKAWVYGGVCEQELYHDYDEVNITSYPNCPPGIPEIDGPNNGKTGQKLEFKFRSNDTDGNQILYYIDWGDGLNQESELMDSGEILILNKSYETEGNYTIKASAKDEHGSQSEWSYFGHVVIIKDDDGDEESICITMKKLGIGRVSATIKNNGEVDFTDVDWNISFAKTGFLKGPIFGYDVQNNGTIASLANGAKQTVNTGGMLFGGSIGFLKFGRGSGEITVTANGVDYSKEFAGWVFGKIVLIT